MNREGLSGLKMVPETRKENLGIREKLIRFYERDEDGRIVNNLYDKMIDCPGPVKAQIPTMIFGSSPEDIKEDTSAVRYGYVDYNQPIYDDRGFDIGYDAQVVVGCIENYVVFAEAGKPPLYVFDNHNHALFAWEEAREAGLISDGAVLVRFDDHLDMKRVMPKDFGALSRDKIKASISNDAFTGIDIENFTRFAFDDDLVGEMVFIHGRAKKAEDADYFEGNDQISDLNKSGRFTFASPILFEKGVDFFVAKIKKMKDAGTSIILDIDFDIFRDELPEDEVELLEKAMLNLLDYADLVTCATSPGYGLHSKNVERAREFAHSYFGKD